MGIYFSPFMKNCLIYFVLRYLYEVGMTKNIGRSIDELATFYIFRWVNNVFHILLKMLHIIVWFGPNCLGKSTLFLAPPAERQRSFSNADSSVVRRRPSSVVNFSIKSLISQKLSDNFFSFLACSFLRMVPMHSTNMDLVESS